MSTNKILTKEFAQKCLEENERPEWADIVDEQFLADKDFSEYTEIEDAAARVLAFHGGGLCLNGLVSLSDNVANQLADHREGRLELNGVTNLSCKSAAALARHKGGLSLNGLTTLVENSGHMALATKLASQGSRENLMATEVEDQLIFNGLTKISAQAAEILGGFKGKQLSFDSLANLSPSAARALAKFKGSFIYFGGIKCLSEAVAEEFANFEGYFNFEKIDILTPEAAGALAKVKGEVNLPGLIALDNSNGHIALAAKLAQSSAISLDSLVMLSDESAMALAKHKGRGRVKIGVNSLSESSARTALAMSIAQLPPDCWVILDNLRIITDEFAEALGRRKGWLSLMGIKEISLAAARSLSDLQNFQISKEGKKMINAAKKATQKSSGRTAKPKSPLGCPDSVLDWVNGGILLAEVNYSKLIHLVDSTKMDYEILPNTIAEPWCAINGIGVCHETPEGYENIAEYVSAKLQAQAVHVWYDNIAGVVGYLVYKQGKLVEQYTTEGDFSSELTSDAPTNLKPSGDGVGIDFSFINKRFKTLKIALPNKIK